MIGDGRGNGALWWMALLAVLFLGLRAFERPLAPADASGEQLDWRVIVPVEPGADFMAPPATRRILLANGGEVNEEHVAAALQAGGHARTWSAFTWQVDREVVSTIAPGLDRRHHFANAYLVGYVPFPEVEAWVPLAALAQRKRYEFDHAQYPGTPELWQTSREAFFQPRGDCEDHAIALADWLIGLGHDARVVIGTMRGGAGHAWVVVLDGSRTYLLEATDKHPGKALPLASTLPGYQPEAMFNRDTYWVNSGSPLTMDYRGERWQRRSVFRRG
jgi:hypothetical protein